MVHISQIHKITEKGEFSLRFIAQTGEDIVVKRGICTSFHSSGRTMNIKFCESGEVRKIRRASITEINGQEVVL